MEIPTPAWEFCVRLCSAVTFGPAETIENRQEKLDFRSDPDLRE